MPAKLRPRGGCSVNSFFPVKVAVSARPTGVVVSVQAWLSATS